MTRPLAAINVLRSTPESVMLDKTDNGRFVRDLADRGLSAVVTNMGTFIDGDSMAFVPRFTDDGVVFEPRAINVANIKTMQNRVLSPHGRPEAAHIPKLNPDALKLYAGSKSRMYDEVLAQYQVETHLIHMDDDTLGDIETALTLFADERQITVKSDNGTGSKSTRHMDLSELASYVDMQLKNGNSPNLVVQPRIDFGDLPQDVTGHTPEDQKRVDTTREQALLNEVRIMCVKSGDKLTFIPVLRVVMNKEEAMGGASDTYIDIDISDELLAKLELITADVVRRTTVNAGDIQHAFAAVDFYFNESGEPRVMEVNMRSPVAPRTDKNPHSGRLMHAAIADTMYDMAEGVANE